MRMREELIESLTPWFISLRRIEILPSQIHWIVHKRPIARSRKQAAHRLIYFFGPPLSHLFPITECGPNHFLRIFNLK